MKLSKISLYAFIIIILVVASYAGLVIWVSWPFEAVNIEKVGVFGDSFGLLTSLFSGLAFYGIIVTILLQREELQLQRVELARSSEAQERAARLMALNELLSDYKQRIAISAESCNKMAGSTGFPPEALERENDSIKFYAKKRDAVLKELEDIVKL